MSRKVLISFVLSYCWVFVLMQRLCSDRVPNDRNPLDCCKIPSPIDSMITQSCNNNYSENTQRQLRENQGSEMPKGNCIAECIANQTKIYRGSGMIDRIHLARLFLNSVSGNKNWGEIVANAVATCVNETYLTTVQLRESYLMKQTFDGEIICHPISGYILGCMNTELFKRCPNMTQSVECDALKQYSNNCHINIKYNENNKYSEMQDV